MIMIYEDADGYSERDTTPGGASQYKDVVLPV